MGIDTRVYTVYGVKVDWDDSFNQAITDYIDPDDGPPLHTKEELPDIVGDYMGGKYFIIGKILFKTSSFRWGGYEDDIMKEIDPAFLEEYENDYRSQFKQFFPKHYHLLNYPFKIITFMHFS